MLRLTLDYLAPAQEMGVKFPQRPFYIKMKEKEKIQREIDLIKYSENNDLVRIRLYIAILVPTFIGVILFVTQEDALVYWVGLIFSLLFALNVIFRHIKPTQKNIKAKTQMIRERYKKLGVNVIEIDNELIKLIKINGK